MRRKAYRPIKKCFQGMEQTNSEYMRIILLCYVSIYLETICVLYVKEGDLPFKSRGNQHDQSG